jgi:hypothetical protein
MKLPQLSLRELFVLVALVAMGCGWWLERSYLIAFGDLWHTRAESLKRLVESGNVFDSDQCDDEGLLVEWLSDDLVVAIINRSNAD